jgi:hypothetical protein
MEKSSMKYLAILAVLALAFFFVGRCSAPAPAVTQSQRVDSLERMARSASNREIALRRAATEAFKRGAATQLQKREIVVRYIRDTAQLHRYKKHVRDSLARLLLAGNSNDESEFTFEAVNGALDLGAKVEKLEAEWSLDSLAAEDYKEAYLKSEAALNECGKKGSALGEEVAILKKEVKRQKGLKWLFAAVGLIVGKVI